MATSRATRSGRSSYEKGERFVFRFQLSWLMMAISELSIRQATGFLFTFHANCRRQDINYSHLLHYKARSCPLITSGYRSMTRITDPFCKDTNRVAVLWVMLSGFASWISAFVSLPTFMYQQQSSHSRSFAYDAEGKLYTGVFTQIFHTRGTISGDYVIAVELHEFPLRKNRTRHEQERHIILFCLLQRSDRLPCCRLTLHLIFHCWTECDLS